jgi:hypothetical protein
MKPYKSGGLRMRTDKELDELYERASPHPGWLSYLLDAKAVNDAETEYLVWRDECDAPVKKKIRIWEAQLEAYGGIAFENAETSMEQLQAIDQRIKSIDQKCANQPYPIAEAMREVGNYRRLVSLRAQLRMELMPPELMSQDKIDKARAYPLDELLKGKLVKKFMKCPVHPEKHGSFYVTSYGFCFGCGRSWNAIGWLMDFEKMTFKQAVEHLGLLG